MSTQHVINLESKGPDKELLKAGHNQKIKFVNKTGVAIELTFDRPEIFKRLPPNPRIIANDKFCNYTYKQGKSKIEAVYTYTLINEGSAKIITRSGRIDPL